MLLDFLALSGKPGVIFPVMMKRPKKWIICFNSSKLMQSKCIRRKCSHYFDEKGSDDVKINDLYHPMNRPSEKSNKRTSFHQDHSSFFMHQMEIKKGLRWKVARGNTISSVGILSALTRSPPKSAKKIEKFINKSIIAIKWNDLTLQFYKSFYVAMRLES